MSSPVLGWRLASFLADRLVHAPRHQLRSQELFDAYCAWCERRDAVPYLEAQFLAEVTTLAHDIELPVMQTGAHIVFWDVALVEGGLS